MRNGFDEFGFLSMRVGVSPLTDGVPGRGRNGGWPGGLSAIGYVAKYTSNEWFSWKMTTRCLIGVFGFAGSAGAAEDAEAIARSRASPVLVTPGEYERPAAEETPGC